MGLGYDVVVLTLERMVVLVCVQEGRMAWVVERLDGVLQVPQGFWRALGRSPLQFPILSLFQQQCVFGQSEKKW